jgi:RimJ/RimL family protein N-acetyltransferase
MVGLSQACGSTGSRAKRRRYRLSIGEASLVGKGIGSSAIREFILIVVSSQPGITAVVTDPEERNGRSCRAFEKSGFISVRTVELEGEKVHRSVMHLSSSAFMSQPINALRIDSGRGGAAGDCRQDPT